jgi:hypothetical protein
MPEDAPPEQAHPEQEPDRAAREFAASFSKFLDWVHETAAAGRSATRWLPWWRTTWDPRAPSTPW